MSGNASINQVTMQLINDRVTTPAEVVFDKNNRYVTIRFTVPDKFIELEFALIDTKLKMIERNYTIPNRQEGEEPQAKTLYEFGKVTG